MMMKKYAVAAAFAGSLLAAPAFAQDASSCTTMLSDFDSHLAANNIQATDERVTAARTEAEQACMSGDMTAAEASLDKAVADLGIPPRAASGDASGGQTGSTEVEAGDQSGTAATGTTTGGTDSTGAASGSSTTTTGTGTTTGSGSDTQSGGSTTGGTTSTQ
jgi:hypothetical protein